MAVPRLRQLRAAFDALTARRNQITDANEDEPAMLSLDVRPLNQRSPDLRDRQRRPAEGQETVARSSRQREAEPRRLVIGPPTAPTAPWGVRGSPPEQAWWGGRDSNPRPRDYESPALTH
jgi:hypothetical protein